MLIGGARVDAASNEWFESINPYTAKAWALVPRAGAADVERAWASKTERELMPDGLVLRYDTSKADDGLPPGEGVFLACSFRMVIALKAIGRHQDARALFERLLGLRNDLGLLSEEYDIAGKRLVGNFPQAFSHIALVNAAFDLDSASNARLRAHRDSEHKRANPKPK